MARFSGRHQADQRGYQQNHGGRALARPPLDLENEEAISLLLHSAPGSPRRLEVLIFRLFQQL